MNDNRKYSYSTFSKTFRREYSVILDWIPYGSKVVDLGCGDASLLELLMQKKGIKGEGIDIASGVEKTGKVKQINVQRGKIDKILPYKKFQFDYAICNVTIQMLMCPEILISEMARIAKYQIISFPNFGFILNRLDMLLNGRMPRVMIPGYEWYSTGHIHQLSVYDFESYCKKHGLSVFKKHFLYPKNIVFLRALLNIFPNFFSTIALYCLKSTR